MNIIIMEEKIATWHQEKRERYRNEQRQCWERHNPARNIAHKGTIQQRIQADNNWIAERDRIFQSYAF